jgi:hypothetical protein
LLLLLLLRLHHRLLRLLLHCVHWLLRLQPSFLRLQPQQHYPHDDASYASYEPWRPAGLLLLP